MWMILMLPMCLLVAFRLPNEENTAQMSVACCNSADTPFSEADRVSETQSIANRIPAIRRAESAR